MKTLELRDPRWHGWRPNDRDLFEQWIAAAMEAQGVYVSESRWCDWLDVQWDEWCIMCDEANIPRRWQYAET